MKYKKYSYENLLQSILSSLVNSKNPTTTIQEDFQDILLKEDKKGTKIFYLPLNTWLFFITEENICWINHDAIFKILLQNNIPLKDIYSYLPKFCKKEFNNKKLIIKYVGGINSPVTKILEK